MTNHLERKLEFEQWIRDYVDRLTRLAYTYTRDWGKSEDAVQDAFIKAYVSREQLKNAENPFPWLARIVVNQCRTIRRRAWREVIMDLLPERKSRGAEESAIASETTSVIHESVMALPESLRVPLHLYYFEEMPTKEIATIMGVSDSAIRIRLTRARDRLAAELKRREDNECRGEFTGSKISIASPRR